MVSVAVFSQDIDVTAETLTICAHFSSPVVGTVLTKIGVKSPFLILLDIVTRIQVTFWSLMPYEPV